MMSNLSPQHVHENERPEYRLLALFYIGILCLALLILIGLESQDILGGLGFWSLWLLTTFLQYKRIRSDMPLKETL